MLPGLGSGGRKRWEATGSPSAEAAASCSRGRNSEKRSIRPLINVAGPECGIPAIITLDRTQHPRIRERIMAEMAKLKALGVGEVD